MIITTQYPCCNGTARFHAIAVPVEKYSRICPSCGQRWEVTRKSKSKSDKARIDVFEWEIKTY